MGTLDLFQLDRIAKQMQVDARFKELTAQEFQGAGPAVANMNRRLNE